MNSRDIRGVSAEIVEICHLGLDVPQLVRRAVAVLRRAVPFERSCWHTIDPATSMLTGAIKDDFVADPRFPRYEYALDDVNKFAYLARQRRTSGILGQATGGFPEQSARYRDLLRPLGIAFELRSAFVLGEECWGACAIYRGADQADFRDEEADLLAALAPVLAEGFRKALLVGDRKPPVADSGPGLVLLDDDDTVRSITGAARRLLETATDVGIPSPGRLPAIVYAVAARARAAARDRQDATSGASARARTLTRSGHWLVLHGTRLDGSTEGLTAIIVEPARPAEIAPLIVQAYGLSNRERDVTRLTVLGLPTMEIARRLYLSPLTVQDHLKAIFGKVGVHSRKELVARIFVDHYEPRLRRGEAPAADGFFPARIGGGG